MPGKEDGSKTGQVDVMPRKGRVVRPATQITRYYTVPRKETVYCIVTQVGRYEFYATEVTQYRQTGQVKICHAKQLVVRQFTQIVYATYGGMWTHFVCDHVLSPLKL